MGRVGSAAHNEGVLLVLIENVKTMGRLDQLIYWITEREKMRKAKEAGKPRPWTDDEILQNYRFCNVNREDDKVTKWIAKNWREPNAGHGDLWFTMAVARWINWPDTLEKIGFPIPWKPKEVISTMEGIRNEGGKVWTGAYMIGTQGNKKDKILFVIENVLQPLWDRKTQLRPARNTTLKDFADRLMAIKNQGSFMVGQIVADIKYDTESPLYAASDWHTFAVSGPGSRRGMNRLLNRQLTATWNEARWHHKLLELQGIVNEKITADGIEPLHAQDLQNCLCEYDKMLRVLYGEGKPRSKYNGKG
jgi:hypothetical protein